MKIAIKLLTINYDHHKQLVKNLKGFKIQTTGTKRMITQHNKMCNELAEAILVLNNWKNKKQKLQQKHGKK